MQRHFKPSEMPVGFFNLHISHRALVLKYSLRLLRYDPITICMLWVYRNTIPDLSIYSFIHLYLSNRFIYLPEVPTHLWRKTEPDIH